MDFITYQVKPKSFLLFLFFKPEMIACNDNFRTNLILLFFIKIRIYKINLPHRFFQFTEITINYLFMKPNPLDIEATNQISS